MATFLTITATHDGTVTNRDVREALRRIDPEAISASSPVTSPGTLATAHEVVDEGTEPIHRVSVLTGDMDAEFTRTTTDAILTAVSTIDGVVEVDVDGGYEETS